MEWPWCTFPAHGASPLTAVGLWEVCQGGAFARAEVADVSSLEATMCEENMVESFRVLQSESGVVTLRQLDSLLRNVAGLERDRFTDKLATLLKTEPVLIGLIG